MLETLNFFFHLYYYKNNEDQLYDFLCSYILEKGPVFIKLTQILLTKNFINSKLKVKLLNVLNINKDINNRNQKEIDKIIPLIKLKNINYILIDGGSICNIYRATYIEKEKEYPVIIKLCHPHIKNKVKKNIKLLKNILNYGSYFNKKISLIKDCIHLKSYFQELINQCD